MTKFLDELVKYMDEIMNDIREAKLQGVKQKCSSRHLSEFIIALVNEFEKKLQDDVHLEDVEIRSYMEKVAYASEHFFDGK